MLADGVLGAVQKKRKGHQLIIGKGYGVQDFINEVASRDVRIKAKMVVVMLGNEQILPGCNVNVAKQMEKLILQLWIVQPTASIFVSSLLPHPTQETDTRAVIMKANAGLSGLCKRLNKHQENYVKYLPVHQLLLEKCSLSDETGAKRSITRIKQPHAMFYQIGSDILNEKGAELVLDEVDRLVAMAASAMKPLRDRMGLRIVIENEHGKGESSKGNTESQDPDPQTQMSKKRKKSGELLEQEHLKRKSVKSANRSSNEQDLIDAGSSRSGQVAVMVDKWEKLSQRGPSVVDSLDLELGEDAIVRVDLGDQPSSTDKGSDEEEVMKVMKDI